MTPGSHGPRICAAKRVGVPEYQLTSIVWCRGVIADEYGVQPGRDGVVRRAPHRRESRRGHGLHPAPRRPHPEPSSGAEPRGDAARARARCPVPLHPRRTTGSTAAGSTCAPARRSARCSPIRRRGTAVLREHRGVPGQPLRDRPPFGHRPPPLGRTRRLRRVRRGEGAPRRPWAGRAPPLLLRRACAGGNARRPCRGPLGDTGCATAGPRSRRSNGTSSSRVCSTAASASRNSFSPPRFRPDPRTLWRSER